ncbi:hypothetical protein [Streptomyces sp. NPDC048277]|uniref:hypothetical protein n=1 Tax=Streptomyces sp. NPDC048277 TaxID=3155027 RepID=UPI0033E2F4AD
MLFSDTSRHPVASWAGVVLLCVGYWITSSLGGHDADQQAMHDRGVTATGVVTRTSDDDNTAKVRLGDGTTLTVSGDGPEVGSTVQMEDRRGAGLQNGKARLPTHRPAENALSHFTDQRVVTALHWAPWPHRRNHR